MKKCRLNKGGKQARGKPLATRSLALSIVPSKILARSETQLLLCLPRTGGPCLLTQDQQLLKTFINLKISRDRWYRRSLTYTNRPNTRLSSQASQARSKSPLIVQMSPLKTPFWIVDSSKTRQEGLTTRFTTWMAMWRLRASLKDPCSTLSFPKKMKSYKSWLIK